MLEKYDSASCVTELQARINIVEALRTGWRPSDDGSLPAPARYRKPERSKNGWGQFSLHVFVVLNSCAAQFG